MTTFVHCRGCGHQIPKTAPMCPKCGAPQAAAGQTPSTAMPPLASSPSAYGQIPWFRQRWAVICIFLVFAPAAAVIAWSGEIYYVVGSTVKTFPKRLKIVMTCMVAGLLIAAASEEEALMGLAGMCLFGMAIGISLRR